MGTTITFNDATEKETLRRGFDDNGLSLNIDFGKAQGHLLVSRDDLTQTYALLVDQNGKNQTQLAKRVNNLDSGHVKYVPITAIPARFIPTKRDNF